MQVTYATEAAPGHINEDAAVCGDGWAVVLDGATAPEGVDSGCIHDVSWLVSHLSAEIAKCMLIGFKSLEDVLGVSIANTCLAHATTCDLSNLDSPSSTVAIVRVRDRELDYLVLADSAVVIRVPGETLRVYSDNRIAHLPGGRPYSLEIVRSMRNQPGGFWVASTNPGAAYHACTGGMSLTAGTKVGLFTDGISRLVEFYGWDWDQVFAVMETSGPAEVIAALRSLEMEHPPTLGKKHDDATAVLMTGDRAGLAGMMRRPADWRTLVGM